MDGETFPECLKPCSASYDFGEFCSRKLSLSQSFKELEALILLVGNASEKTRKTRGKNERKREENGGSNPDFLCSIQYLKDKHIKIRLFTNTSFLQLKNQTI